MNKHAIKVDKKFLPWSGFIVICTILIFFNLLILYFLPANIYVDSAFILTVFFTFKFFKLNSINFYIYDFVYLIIASALVLLNNYILSYRWLDSISFYILSLFILATLVYIYEEKLEYKIALKKRNIAYSYLSLFSIIIFLTSVISFNFIYIKVNFFNKFYTEKYFNEIEVLKINDENIDNEMEFLVDTPGDYYIIDDIFKVEGWAIDKSDIPGTKIDYVGIYLDNNPRNGGEFISRCEYGIEREDIGKKIGDKFEDSGFFCQVDSNKIEDGLRKFYIYFNSNNFEWKYTTLDLFINNDHSFIFEDILDKKNKDVELKYTNIDANDQDIIMGGSEHGLKYIKFPVTIESDQDYLVSFEIKKTYILNNVLNNTISFDFYGDGYDNPEQEFRVEPVYIDENYKKINRIINAGEIPLDKNIYFRIYTYSDGSVKVKNLSIYKVIKS